MMNTRTFRIIDINSEIEIEYLSRKEMLSWLKEYSENVIEFSDCKYCDFSGESYEILYDDGTTDYIDEEYDGHKIRKTHIVSIVNCNPCTYAVYGHFSMNEYGCCSASFVDEISEENIEEIKNL